MSPRWGSIPRRTDQLFVSRKVTSESRGVRWWPVRASWVCRRSWALKRLSRSCDSVVRVSCNCKRLSCDWLRVTECNPIIQLTIQTPSYIVTIRTTIFSIINPYGKDLNQPVYSTVGQRLFLDISMFRASIYNTDTIGTIAPRSVK
jgi:hypothetical protein